MHRPARAGSSDRFGASRDQGGALAARAVRRRDPERDLALRHQSLARRRRRRGRPASDLGSAQASGPRRARRLNHSRARRGAEVVSVMCRRCMRCLSQMGVGSTSVGRVRSSSIDADMMGTRCDPGWAGVCCATVDLPSPGTFHWPDRAHGQTPPQGGSTRIRGLASPPPNTRCSRAAMMRAQVCRMGTFRWPVVAAIMYINERGRSGNQPHSVSPLLSAVGGPVDKTGPFAIPRRGRARGGGPHADPAAGIARS